MLNYGLALLRGSGGVKDTLAEQSLKHGSCGRIMCTQHARYVHFGAAGRLSGSAEMGTKVSGVSRLVSTMLHRAYLLGCEPVSVALPWICFKGWATAWRINSCFDTMVKKQHGRHCFYRFPLRLSTFFNAAKNPNPPARCVPSSMEEPSVLATGIQKPLYLCRSYRRLE